MQFISNQFTQKTISQITELNEKIALWEENNKPWKSIEKDLVYTQIGVGTYLVPTFDIAETAISGLEASSVNLPENFSKFEHLAITENVYYSRISYSTFLRILKDDSLLNSFLSLFTKNILDKFKNKYGEGPYAGTTFSLFPPGYEKMCISTIRVEEGEAEFILRSYTNYVPIKIT